MQPTGSWSSQPSLPPVTQGLLCPTAICKLCKKLPRERPQRQLLPEPAGGRCCCAAPGPGCATQDIVGGHGAIPASPGAASERMVMGMEHLKSSVRVPGSACTSSGADPLPSCLELPPWQLETKRKHFKIQCISTSVAVLLHLNIQLSFSTWLCNLCC